MRTIKLIGRQILDSEYPHVSCNQLLCRLDLLSVKNCNIMKNVWNLPEKGHQSIRQTFVLCLELTVKRSSRLNLKMVLLKVKSVPVLLDTSSVLNPGACWCCGERILNITINFVTKLWTTTRV